MYVFKKYRFLLKNTGLWASKYRFVFPEVGMSAGAKICVTLLVPLSKVLYSNCSVVQRSHKSIGPMYMYLNINTSVHVKECHRLLEKSRGSSQYSLLTVLQNYTHLL